MATKIFALLTWIDKLCKLIMDKNYHHHCNEMQLYTSYTITIKPNIHITYKELTTYIYKAIHRGERRALEEQR